MKKDSNEKGTGKAPFVGSDFWDARFGEDMYVYGEVPNQFFKEQIDRLTPGRALFVAEGEGRNAVYAAQLGWEVDAIDFSGEGKAKAEKLAKSRSVEINYQIADATRFETDQRYELIVFVFFHLAEELREATFRRYISFLKPGGKILAELYSPKQLGRTTGGPQRADFLISREELKATFGEMNIRMLEEVEVELDEGPFHKGLSSTNRLVAQKA